MTPPRRDRAPQQPRPEQLVLQPDETLAQRLRPAGRDGERDVGRQRADIGDVVVDALELQQHHPQRAGAGGTVDAGETLDGVRVGQRVTDRRVAGDRFGEEQPVTPRQPLEALLGALVHVEQPKLQVQHGLAGDAKPEVPGLDDAGVHGPHRHLEHTFAGHGPERVEIPSTRGTTASFGKVLAERPRAVGPVVMESDTRRVRMARRA